MVIELILKKVNTCLTIHQWNKYLTDIATLRFFIDADPGNFLCKNFEEHVFTQISHYNKIDKKKIPPFKCNCSSPFASDKDGNRTSTKAYDFQCRWQDATKYKLHILIPQFLFFTDYVTRTSECIATQSENKMHFFPIDKSSQSMGSLN